jgi:hypothetical protein
MFPVGFTEITFDQFKKWVLKDTPKTFEIGKWYKSDYQPSSKGKFFYIKVKELKNGHPYGEGISSEGFYGKEKSWTSKKTKERALELEPLTDLTEIQEFLPEGHVDLEIYLP